MSGCGNCENCDCGKSDIDISKLGPEAVALDKLFGEMNEHLISALKVRKSILETLHSHPSEETKEKLERVIEAQHPALRQFVFGNE